MIVFLVIFICMGILFLFISSFFINFVNKRLNEKIKELDTELFNLKQQNWILRNQSKQKVKL